MTTRLTLICHAATEATRAARFPRDEPLDPAGEAAAAHAATSPTLVETVGRATRRLCAPATRTRQTAAAFATPFTEDVALADVRPGTWAGRSIADIAATEPEALAAWMADPATTPPGGESLGQLLARVEAWMEDRRRSAAVSRPSRIPLSCGPPASRRSEPDRQASGASRRLRLPWRRSATTSGAGHSPDWIGLRP